jgi:cell division cycle protein 20 (cofactor of APC complex)
LLQKKKGHGARVGALSWNNHVLSTGCKDSHIRNFDVRIRDALISVYSNHTNEVCGLKWNADGTQLASGSKSNKLSLLFFFFSEA